MRGADQYGRCLWLEKSVTTKSPTKIYTPPSDLVLSSIEELLYLNDPVLTFEDSMLFGCYVEFNYDELEQFCENQGWYNMLIFQNFY